ncbi:hypothetical protein [Curtobacterium sp. Leaf154]|nr:hypothetical protein [Curtobacterium sp. Leaf154]
MTICTRAGISGRSTVGPDTPVCRFDSMATWGKSGTQRFAAVASGSSSRGRRRRLRRVVWVPLAIGCAVLTLAGCAEDEPPAVYPDVRWVGAAPSGPLEKDPWVRAVRAELEAEAVARNRNDFSIPELAHSATPSYIDRLASVAMETLRQNHDTDLFAGPWPFAPTEVELGNGNNGEDVAAVRGCKARNWTMTPGRSLGSLDAGYGVEYRLERDGNGVVRVDSIAGLPNCDGRVPLRVAMFDPVPEPSSVTDVNELVRPDGTTVGRPRR